MTKLEGGGKKLPPPTWNKLAQRQRGIGLIKFGMGKLDHYTAKVKLFKTNARQMFFC